VENISDPFQDAQTEKKTSKLQPLKERPSPVLGKKNPQRYGQIE
jgi:hypothetical protein